MQRKQEEKVTQRDKKEKETMDKGFQLRASFSVDCTRVSFQ
jgi:hypothetical protein